MKKKRFLLILAAVLIVVAVFALDCRLRVVEYEITSPKLCGEVRLALVTDLHSCRYGEEQGLLIDKIGEYSPRAVLLGGDIFDDEMDNTNAETFVRRVSEEYDTYYVSGNHEWWSNEAYELFGILEECGVTILRGDSVRLEPGVVLSGIDDPDVDEYDSTAILWSEQLSRVGESLDEGEFDLLLSHRPERAEDYFEYGFDLVLSGHAHGGQFRIPFILNGLFAPNQGLFPRLAGGEYDFGEGKLIVSRGLSRENQIVPRIFNRPELVFITLKGDGNAESEPPAVSSTEGESIEEIRGEIKQWLSPDSVEEICDSYGNESFRAFAERRLEENFFYMPTLDGEVIDLRGKEGYSNMTLFPSELYGMPWMWYHCVADGTELTVKVTYPETVTEDVSELISLLAPDAPNLHNIGNHPSYESVSMIEAGERRVMESRVKDSPRRYYAFVFGDALVKIHSDSDLAENGILERLAFKKVIINE